MSNFSQSIEDITSTVNGIRREGVPVDVSFDQNSLVKLGLALALALAIGLSIPKIVQSLLNSSE